MNATLEAVTALRPAIEARREEIRAHRRLPKDLVDDLRAAGVFRMEMPTAWGGPELSVLDQCKVIEELSYAEGSVGWCAMIGCDSGYYSAFLDEDVGRALYPSLDLVTAGLAQPAGRAVREGDHWRVSGRWAFGSGATHADRIVGGCFLHDENGGPMAADGGLPAWQTLFLPIEQVEIHDTWHTHGLEGSGSHDYSLEGALVPIEHGFYPLGETRREGPLYALPWWFIVKLGAVPIGLARRAIDELLLVADTKLLVPEFVLARDAPRTQAAVARATGLVESAAALFEDAIGSAWDTLAAGDQLADRQRGMLRLAMTHAAVSGREAITLLFDVASTTAIFTKNRLDQILRDITTVSQHITVQARTYEPIGRRLMGIEPNYMML